MQCYEILTVKVLVTVLLARSALLVFLIHVGKKIICICLKNTSELEQMGVFTKRRLFCSDIIPFPKPQVKFYIFQQILEWDYKFKIKIQKFPMVSL